MAKDSVVHDFTPTEKTRVKRLHERGHYDRETVYGILDAGFICHVGYLIDDQPFVTPTSYWREGDRVYWHGSSASRMLRTISKGIKVCLTVTHVDGLVLARSGFHSSINYRAVMAFGEAEMITDAGHKEQALKAFMEHVTPGRWAMVRQVTSQELKGTTVLSMMLDEVSAKVRTGPPKDDEEDYALPIWAGVLPLKITSGPPEPDPRLTADVPIPEHARRFVLER
jgi:nitroimidazol reductase NimA-like FMN-containing flavoprotein (pyridoxamine 5'-phosphate oxidase superfamily)